MPDVSEVCQPDTAAFLPYDAPNTDITGPNVSDNGTDTSGTGDGAEREAEDEEDARFSTAVANMVNLLNKRDPDFEYPAALREMAVKRDVYAALLHRRQETATASCTPMVAAATAQPTTSSDSSSSTSAGQRRVPGGLPLTLSVLAVIGSLMA